MLLANRRQPFGSRPNLDLPVLVAAVVLSSVGLFNLGIALAKDRCHDAGGRVVEAGLDRVCELGAGATMPLSIAPTTPLAWLLAFAVWTMLVLGITWGVSRLLRSRQAASDAGQSTAPP